MTIIKLIKKQNKLKKLLWNPKFVLEYLLSNKQRIRIDKHWSAYLYILCYFWVLIDKILSWKEDWAAQRWLFDGNSFYQLFVSKIRNK